MRWDVARPIFDQADGVGSTPSVDGGTFGPGLHELGRADDVDARSEAASGESLGSAVVGGNAKSPMDCRSESGRLSVVDVPSEVDE
jgi:hypothetical protein